MEKWGLSQAHTAKNGQALALWISQDIGNKELALCACTVHIMGQWKAVGRGLAIDHFRVKVHGLRVCVGVHWPTLAC